MTTQSLCASIMLHLSNYKFILQWKGIHKTVYHTRKILLKTLEIQKRPVPISDVLLVGKTKSAASEI